MAKTTKRTTITREIVEKVINYKNAGLNNSQIAMKIGISGSSVYRILKGERNYLLDTENVFTEDEEIEKNNVSLRSDHYTLVEKKARINVAVFPNDNTTNQIDAYLFKDKIPKDLMFDYKKLFYFCKDFIRENIPFNDSYIPMKGVVFYATGSSTALIAFINACFSLKIPLYVAHYDNISAKYKLQLVHTRYDVRNDGYYWNLGNILNDYDKVYLYKSKVEDILCLNNIYGVIINNNTIVLVDNVDDTYALYNKLSYNKNYKIKIIKYNNKSGIFTYATKLV